MLKDGCYQRGIALPSHWLDTATESHTVQQETVLPFVVAVVALAEQLGIRNFLRHEVYFFLTVLEVLCLSSAPDEGQGLFHT